MQNECQNVSKTFIANNIKIVLINLGLKVNYIVLLKHSTMTINLQLLDYDFG